MDSTACPDLNNLFARMLASASRRLVRHGLDKNYLQVEEDTSCVRGRINFSESAKRQTWKHGRLHCGYDERSPDVLHNRILRSTLAILRSDQGIRLEMRRQLAGYSMPLWAFHPPMRIRARRFRRVQLHRNNRSYRFLLHLCELIHGSLLPEQSSSGHRRFRDFTRDERTMAHVFESFVRRLCERAYRAQGVGNDCPLVRMTWTISPALFFPACERT